MGNNGTRVIEVDRLQNQLAQCNILEQKNCPVYGPIHLVSYNDMQFNLGQSQNQETPHPMSLHYLVKPGILIISDFQLLEDINPSSLESLLQIISGIAEMAIDGGAIGIGNGRVAYAGRWGVVGEQPINWAYQQVLEGQSYEGAYLSPQLMISLSQGRTIPKHNAEKSDVYALGIMLVEIIFQEKLYEIFDYDNYEIRLNPLLGKLLQIRQAYGDAIYQIFIGMLETEEADRFTFEEIYQAVEDSRKTHSKMVNSRMNSSTHSRDMQRGNHTPTRNRVEANNASRTPKGRQNPYRNDLSPFRGRFAPNARMPERVGRTPDRNRVRQQQTSRSPLRRDLKINTQFGRESQQAGYGGEMGRRQLSPISRR